MARPVYRINRIDAPSIYKARLKDVHEWSARNPGEMQSYDTVDPIEELNELAGLVFEFEWIDAKSSVNNDEDE